MLAGMRKSASGFLAKLLLAALMASFALWGIGDMFRGGGATALATIGDESITEEEYRFALERLQRSFGENYSQELFQELGLYEQLLSRLINQSLFRQEARAIGLRFPREQLAEEIRKNPNFKSESGQFDKSLFALTLRNNRLSEAQYLSRIAEELSVRLLEASIADNVDPPRALLEHFYRLSEERRDVSLILISPKQIGPIDNPDETTLQRYFEQVANLYVAPEYRQISYIALTSDDILNHLGTDDAALKAYYEAEKERFTTPEKRRVEQLLFANEANARAVYEKLQSGVSFEKAATDPSVQNSHSLDLGIVARSDTSLTDTDAVVFSLAENAYSEPVKSPFGWHIFHVTAIIPEEIRPYEEVQDEVKAQYKNSALEQETQQLSNRIEDAVAGGASLASLAEEYKVALHHLGPVTISGLDDQGNQAAADGIEKAALTEGFTLEEGRISSLRLSENGVYFLVYADTILPERKKGLPEVQGAVTAAWKEKERTRLLQKMAADLADQLRSEGESHAETLKKNNIKLTAFSDLTRFNTKVPLNGKPLELTEGFLTELFRQPEKATTDPYPLPSGEYAIGLIEKIKPVTDINYDDKETAEAISLLKQRIASVYKQELLEEYIGYLRTKYPVSINRERFAAFTAS